MKAFNEVVVAKKGWRLATNEHSLLARPYTTPNPHFGRRQKGIDRVTPGQVFGNQNGF